MLTALDAPDEALDSAEQSFVAKIREHGWFRTGVFADADGLGFSYTTGFWRNAGHPELIMFGMKDETAHDIFWDLYRGAVAGIDLPVGKRAEGIFGNAPAYVFPVAKRHYKDHLGWSRWFYAGDEFPCLQIVWPDRTGLFPWEDQFDRSFENSQIDLTERGWRSALAD
ncbi:DUF4262 domain-containing protein [Sphingomonas cannabina]|uniref:DUF4262 domain-containing protein n=1 Tax=Sphingomonas cannabina TaxID=2899123 RepID=UPI001F210805|nr:DUF4262 domain-containing protein [Sphingomonas cannabina]UIJ45278.1 DUF4262 domain-containing protein [Sphingomonas cannabina]